MGLINRIRCAKIRANVGVGGFFSDLFDKRYFEPSNSNENRAAGDDANNASVKDAEHITETATEESTNTESVDEVKADATEEAVTSSSKEETAEPEKTSNDGTSEQPKRDTISVEVSEENVSADFKEKGTDTTPFGGGIAEAFYTPNKEADASIFKNIGKSSQSSNGTASPINGPAESLLKPDGTPRYDPPLVRQNVVEIPIVDKKSTDNQQKPANAAETSNNDNASKKKPEAVKNPQTNQLQANPQTAQNKGGNQGVPPFQPNRGNHRVDNPPKQKPPRTEPDKVKVDLDNISDVEVAKKPQKTWTNVIDASQLNEAFAPKEQEVHYESKFDNREFTSGKNGKRYLSDLERLIVSKGYQVMMRHVYTRQYQTATNGNGEQVQVPVTVPTGLVECIVYTPESVQPNPFKCFTVDTAGVMYDGQTKVFLGLREAGYYEDMPTYPVLVDEKSEGKPKRVLNKPLFDAFLTGGAQLVEAERIKPLYTEKYKELNKRVALITMPTNQMHNKENRIKVRERLMAALDSGKFDEASRIDPYIRFVFDKDTFNKDTLEFTLISKGVTFRYRERVLSTKDIKLVFDKDGNVTMVYDG